LNSYDALSDYIRLVPTTSPTTSYNVRVVAETSANANGNANVPVPSIAWLLVAGLIPLAAMRARLLRRNPFPRAA